MKTNHRAPTHSRRYKRHYRNRIGSLQQTLFTLLLPRDGRRWHEILFIRQIIALDSVVVKANYYLGSLGIFPT